MSLHAEAAAEEVLVTVLVGQTRGYFTSSIDTQQSIVDHRWEEGVLFLPLRRLNVL